MSQLRPRAESPCRTEPPPRAERVALCTACSNTDVTEVRGSVRRCKSADSVPAHAPGALGGRSWSAEKPPRGCQPSSPPPATSCRAQPRGGAWDTAPCAPHVSHL